MSFESNQGQSDGRVQFLSRGRGYALYLNANEAVLTLNKNETAKAATLRMALVGANTAAVGTPQEQLPGTVNYFVGNDPAKWHSALPTYKRVRYQAVYPGIDVVYYGNQRELEYDFVVAPGADASKIALAFTGGSPKIDEAGDLIVALSAGDTLFHKPVVYQLDGDRKVSVEGSYQIADGKVGFALGSYDRSKPLVIDPILSYLTYVGGSVNDQIHSMTVDSAGSVYIVGTTNSPDYRSSMHMKQPSRASLPPPVTLQSSSASSTPRERHSSIPPFWPAPSRAPSATASRSIAAAMPTWPVTRATATTL